MLLRRPPGRASLLLGLSSAVLFGCRLSGAEEVAWGEKTLSLPSFTTPAPLRDAPVADAGRVARPPTERQESKPRDLAAVWIENRWLRVEVVPEIGGAVARAVDLASGNDLFYSEGKIKDWLPYWESGVKVSFPWQEHGVRTADQPASWRVVREPDGAVSVAMWMEFSRFSGPENERAFGRFSTLLLSQRVRLRPDSACLEIEYRAVNPTPYGQGARIWNDTFFPRNHLRSGVVQGDATPPVRDSPTELVFPAAFVSDHDGRDARRWDPAATGVAGYRNLHHSLFAWNIGYGFAGLWYPEAGVNRLRITDPHLAPGAKIYLQGEGGFTPGRRHTHMYNFVELWGGTDSVFEAPEGWLPAGHSRTINYRYAYVPGIGRAEYANAAVALSRDPKAGRVRIQPLRRFDRFEVFVDGQPAGPAGEATPGTVVDVPVGPGSMVALRVLGDGEQVCAVQLPLVPVPDDEANARTRRSMIQSTGDPAVVERAGNSKLRGLMFRDALAGYPDPSVDRGRILYRDGQLEAAVAMLQRAIARDPGNGEGSHLLGMARLELGEIDEARQALFTAAANGWSAARFYLAVLELREGRRHRALDQVRHLVADDPGHWEGRLLEAWVMARIEGSAAESVARASALMLEDPADPRAALVAMECAAAAGDAGVGRTSAEAFEALAREPGAPRRIEEFRSLAAGNFLPPMRLEARSR
jgi:hypothetical protein